MRQQPSEEAMRPVATMMMPATAMVDDHDWRLSAVRADPSIRHLHLRDVVFGVVVLHRSARAVSAVERGYRRDVAVATVAVVIVVVMVVGRGR